MDVSRQPRVWEMVFEIVNTVSIGDPNKHNARNARQLCRVTNYPKRPATEWMLNKSFESKSQNESLDEMVWPLDSWKFDPTSLVVPCVTRSVEKALVV